MGPRKVKVLLVDDSDLMLRYVADLLGRAGYEVVTAQNLVDSVGAYGKHRPDYLLTDFVLAANQTGLEVISVIFSLCSEAGRPPAAILTQGELAPPDRARAAALSVRVIQKPKKGQEAGFLAEIDAWLQARKP